MTSTKSQNPLETVAEAPPPPQLLLQQALSSLHSRFSHFLQNWQTRPSLKTPFPARIFNPKRNGYASVSTSTAKNHALSDELIEERLAGVPVYALSNGSQEFVLVSGTNTGKNLGLFCFGEADAEALLKQMKSVDQTTSSGSQVVAVALSKIFQLKVDGVALRLIPEASQIKNALKERKTAGLHDESFPGVPVFHANGRHVMVLPHPCFAIKILSLTCSSSGCERNWNTFEHSKSLILRSQNKRYQPVFFRKEDLEKSLSRASQDQRQLNPLMRKGDIQVAVLEDIIQGMKDGSVSSWDDVVFVPPGFDVSTDPTQQN